VTSGEVTWRHLVSREDPFYAALGERGFHIGPERDRGLLEGLPYVFIERVEEADFLLCSGADGPEDRVEDYLTVLQAGLRRGLPMVCANPDLEVIRGGKREICAGAIAERYRALGGEVRQHGKPHRDIYEACIEAAGGFTPERTLAIGDSLRTDIAGAQALGIATLLVVDGIHAESLGLGGNGKIEEGRLTALCRSEGACPQWIMKSLRW
jgi:HAD superfamily hydrolase (TIGR01459 family)